MLTVRIIHSILIRQPLRDSQKRPRKTKLTLHPLDDSRQCHTARIPISFAEQDTFYSPIRIETRLWRLTHDDANETCTLPVSLVSLLDSLSDRRLQTRARN